MNNLLILGLETSGILCSLAWWQDGKTLLEYNIERRNAHSTILADMIKRGHEQLDIDPGLISLLAVSSGPGSFTGLRIGMAYAKGFCLGRGIPLVPVTNFEMLATQADDTDHPVYTIIEARKNLYYVGLFTHKYGDLKKKYLADMPSLISEIPANAQIIVHEENQKSAFQAALPSVRQIVQGAYNASIICKIASRVIIKNTAQALHEAEPLYLQAFAGVE